MAKYDDEQEESRAPQDHLRRMHEMEQAQCFLGDYFPALWKRMYDNCRKEGFTEEQSFELLKTYILGAAAGKIDP